MQSLLSWRRDRRVRRIIKNGRRLRALQRQRAVFYENFQGEDLVLNSAIEHLEGLIERDRQFILNTAQEA